MRSKTKKLAIAVPLAVLIGLVGFYFLFPAATFELLMAAERSAAGLKQQRIDVDGLRIEFLEGGKGDNLVLLHGFGADKDNWTRIGRFLTPHFRVVAPDLPGFGESSSNPDADYTISAQVERVRSFVRALGLKSFHLGGSSMGGSIAGAYASMYPMDVKSLLLIAPGGVAASQPSDMYRLLEQGKPTPLIAKSVEDYDYLLEFVFVKRPFIPGAVKRQLVEQAIAHQSLNSRIFKQLVDSRHGQPLEAVLSGLKVPTLIVWGACDRVLHVSGAKILEAAMPAATLAVMDAAGHLPMIERPKETADLYLGFIEHLRSQ